MAKFKVGDDVTPIANVTSATDGVNYFKRHFRDDNLKDLFIEEILWVDQQHGQCYRVISKKTKRNMNMFDGELILSIPPNTTLLEYVSMRTK